MQATIPHIGDAVATPRRWLSRSRHNAVRGLHRASSRGRAFPDFVVIGAQKSGTTSLYRYLTAHPSIVAADEKEVHYFDLNHDRGDDWYRSHFPLRRDLERIARRVGGPALTGEGSPYYLFHPQAPERMRPLLPEARLIVLLRDPVERALSHHNHEVQDGYEVLSLAAAIDAEADRLATAFGHLHHSYLSRGLYADQLEAWFAHYPRKQFLVIESQELFDDPTAAVDRTLAFLGLPPLEHAEYDNVTARSREDVVPEVRRHLYAHFAPHNQRLYELLGTDFHWEERSP
jgi:hypothetical protein